MPVEGGEEVKVLDSVHIDARLGREGVALPVNVNRACSGRKSSLSGTHWSASESFRVEEFSTGEVGKFQPALTLLISEHDVRV